MKKRVQNPADYALILGYIKEKTKREQNMADKAKAEAEFNKGMRNGTYGRGQRPRTGRRR